MRPTAELLARRLEKDPHDAEAYDSLRAIYRESGDYASLTNLVEGWAGFQADPRLASQGFVEAARSWRGGGGDDARTRELLERALERDPAQREATQQLLTLLAEQGDQRAEADFLDSHLRRLETLGGEPAQMAALYTRLGDLWRLTFQRPDVAGPCYQRALELDPLATGASEGATAMALEPRDALMSARLYATEAETETDPERKVELYLKLASLYVAPLEDLDAAVNALRTALSVVPSNVRVMHQLAVCLGRRAALQRPGGEDDATRDVRRVAELYYQIAQAVAPEDALDYLEAALLAEPIHEGALHLLEQLAPPLGKAALLARHWVNYLARASDGPEADARRLQLAQAYALAGQLDDAIYCLEQANPDAAVSELMSELKARRGPRAQPTHVDDSVSAEGTNPSAKPPRPRRHSSERPLDASDRITQLRRAIHDAIVSRASEQAAEHCRALIILEPGDPEAFAFLESYYRRTRDPQRLRELLLASTEVAGVSIDLRKQRLGEVATLSEAKLKDPLGAIEVWRSVVALDPGDADAQKSLKRLLERTERWDELASVLEREALSASSAADKAALLRKIATIHRDKRHDVPEAAEALRQLLALAPDATTRDELCEMLLSIGNHIEAVPLLRERVDLADNERDKLGLLHVLAETLDERQNDAEGAYEVCVQLLELRPRDEPTLLRMERIDERTGNVARLIDTLELRASLALRGERPALLTRMAELAERQLDDVDRAAAFYARALDLVPGDEALLDALCQLFERRQRYPDLAELLKTRIASEKDAARRAELERRRARVLKDHLLRDDEAAEAYRRILAQHEDEEALEFLLEYARGRGDAEAVAELSASLARLVTDPESKRALLLERARVLRDDLDRPREAARALRELVEQVDPNHELAIHELTELCERLGDAAGLSVALRRKHARTADPAARAAIAQRLSDLCEHELRDPEAAIAALSAWTRDEPLLAAPHRRLVKLLAGDDRAAELIASYDALSQLEDAESARSKAALDAAKLAFKALADADGAFIRLGPLVEAGDDEAFHTLADIAEQADRSEALAALCVTAAQRARDPVLQGKNWRAAAHVYAERLANTHQALEAAVRMLATDLSNRAHLGEVEEYAAREKSWPRLAQVYERLLKTARDDGERVELLTRHASLLEERAKDPAEAWSRVLRACALAPGDEALLARAEVLAKRAGRGEELLALYDARQRALGNDLLAKFELLLRAARLCDNVLENRARANAYLKAALAVGAADPRLWERVVNAAESLDRTQPQHGPSAALRQLVQAHRELAERAGPELGPHLILLADGLLRERLRDDRADFDLLRQGLALFPANADVYEALAERATALGELDALDRHLAKCVDQALDPKTASALLTRRVALLEGPLGRPQQAVDVLTKLLQLRPDDLHAASRLRRTLRKARRFQDLLLVIHKQLQRAKEPDDKLALLKESASIWELDLRNRFEARDAWRKALELAPSDPESQAALARVEQWLSSPHAQEEKDDAREGEDEATPDDDAGAGAHAGEPSSFAGAPELAADGGSSDEPTLREADDLVSVSVSVPLQPPASPSWMQQESSLPPTRPGEEDEPVVGAESFNRARTKSGGYTAPGELKAGDPAEDTKEIDVDVDLLAAEPEELDVALEAQEVEDLPVRSLPPPPPKRGKSSMPPPPPRKNG